MVEMQDVEMCVYVNLHTYICWEERGVVVMSLSATLLQLSSQNDVAKTSGQTPLPTTFLTCMLHALHGCSILRMISDGLGSGWARDWKTSPPPAWKQQFSLGTCGLYGSGGMIEILRKAIRWTITITFFQLFLLHLWVQPTDQSRFWKLHPWDLVWKQKTLISKSGISFARFFISSSILVCVRVLGITVAVSLNS